MEKIRTCKFSKPPHVRAAHASATVRDNQVLYYGGSIGNGQYANDELWFLDIKNQEEVNWMLVPIDGQTPGPRYGHSMVYIIPNLILFGGSSNSGQNRRNVIMKDVWIFLCLSKNQRRQGSFGSFRRKRFAKCFFERFMLIIIKCSV